MKAVPSRFGDTEPENSSPKLASTQRTLAMMSIRTRRETALRRAVTRRRATKAGRNSDAIMLFSRFHVGIAEIADHCVFTDVVRDLVSHSSCSA
ncbi:hypothetical protein MesoLjLc_58820 [Mesorhizobium sp. L-8-10]|nr:hypothetical protein MesoLjLc_58820 [Mesorhizobium sp. L-8-10]